jgi:hypothetical protein
MGTDDDWIILDYAITETTYTTSVPLIAGTYYLFKVQSRNEVGFSDLSDALEVYAA